MLKNLKGWRIVVRGVLRIFKAEWVLLLSILLLCGVLYFVNHQFSQSPDPLPFSVAGWKAPLIGQDSIFTGTRLRMVEDLLGRYNFHGWRRNEVEDLLGAPHDVRTSENNVLLLYDLRDGLNLLIFEIDDEQHVVNYYVYRP